MIFHQAANSRSNYNTFFYCDEIWELHFHKNFEVIHVLEGSVDCTVNGVSQTLTAGDFGMCLSYQLHAYRPAENSRYWVGVFSGDYARAFETQVQNKTGSGFRFRCREETLAFLRAYLIREDVPPLYLLKACLYALCEEYVRAVALTEQDAKQDFFIRTVTSFLLENHTKKISLSDVAERLGYEYHYVSRYFHRVFGMSFSEFLSFYRLETASELLTQTEKTITEIAFESGFQSVRSFNHSFQTRLGTSPSDYRRQTRARIS